MLTTLTPNGTRFAVWAPKRKSVAVRIGSQEHPMEPDGTGLFSATVSHAVPGDCYHFLLDHQFSRPDPCSRFQPEGVHGPSQVVDPTTYAWNDGGWRGIPKSGLVVYELHVGTFTPEGTYTAALERLDHVLDLGATAVELMPLAQTPGRWNWGYDGVDLYAPNHNYGTPEELRSFVDTCHQRGLAVILDVVYNHLGPEGNYWADFGPYFSTRHHTPWGPALNFDGKQNRQVRNWIVQNAVYWLAEYHFDGLRLDAIHLMKDDSEHHITAEVSAAVHQFAATRRYPVHLIAESNVHDQKLLHPLPAGSGYDLLWNDEIPHALFSTTLGHHRVHQTRTYEGAADLQQALDAGFVFEWLPNGREIVRSSSVHRADLASMLQGLQTHDAVGNHPLGLRLHQVTSRELQQAAAALLLLHPAIPLCFMGEEFAAPSPFCFFVDFGDPRVRKAVVEGRKRDYAHHNWASFLSPLDAPAFLGSKLPPVEKGDAEMFAWYRALLALRKSWISDGLLCPENLEVRHERGTGVFTLVYKRSYGVAANFGPESAFLPEGAEVLLHSHRDGFGRAPDLETGRGGLPSQSAAVYRLGQPKRPLQRTSSS